MKRYLLMLAVALAFVACDVETDVKAGGTAVEQMAGRWVVTIDQLDASGNVIGANIMGGHTDLYTYNTASNSSKEMWIDDRGEFWEYKLKMDVDYASKSFTTNGAKENTILTTPAEGDPYYCQVTIKDGEVVKDGTKTPSGRVADGISFNISFSDDGSGGSFHVYGYRYTGFPEDR
jgi:hypothetical protein